MAAGLIVALGTTHFWIAADAFLALYLAYHGPRQFRTHPVVLGVAAILLLTTAWTPDPAAAALAAFRVVALYSLARTMRLDWRFWGAAGAVLVVQIAVVAVQLPENSRPWGMSMNASVLGQAGMIFSAGGMGPLGAVTLGLSTARSAALGLAVYTVFKRRWGAWAIAFLAAAVFLVSMHQLTPGRLQLGDIARPGFDGGILPSAQLRVDGITEGTVAPPPADSEAPPIRERVWSWHGYGYHGYYLSTGLQRPHNLWVLSWWDLGVLAVPFWGLVFYGCWRLRNPMVPALLAMGMITEEMISRPEGFYMVAIAMAGQLRPHALPVRGPIQRWSERLQSRIRSRNRTASQA